MSANPESAIPAELHVHHGCETTPTPACVRCDWRDLNEVGDHSSVVAGCSNCGEVVCGDCWDEVHADTCGDGDDAYGGDPIHEDNDGPGTCDCDGPLHSIHCWWVVHNDDGREQATGDPAVDGPAADAYQAPYRRAVALDLHRPDCRLSGAIRSDVNSCDCCHKPWLGHDATDCGGVRCDLHEAPARRASPWPRTPTMTRQHFNYLARALLDAWPNDGRTYTREYVIGQLAGHLADCNSRFDRDRFLAAASGR